MAGLLVDLVPQATDEVLAAPAQQRPGPLRGVVPVRSLRDAMQEFVGRKQSPVAKTRMLVGFAFQSFGEETDGEMAVGLVESGGGQSFGLSVIHIDHGRIVARRAADYRAVRPLLRVGDHDQERGCAVPMPPLPDLPNH